MTGIEKIKQYIKQTDIPHDTCIRHSMTREERVALTRENSLPVWEAVALAFDYGRAKGYRAGKRAAARGSDRQRPAEERCPT